jgi:hypothetical protein
VPLILFLQKVPFFWAFSEKAQGKTDGVFCWSFLVKSSAGRKTSFASPQKKLL